MEVQSFGNSRLLFFCKHTIFQTNISYPTTGFDLKPQTLGKKKQPPYNLIAVTHHIGASTDSGHYVASCRRAKGWVK